MIRQWMSKRFIQFHIFIYRHSGGKIMGYVWNMPILLLTTVGRKTGKQRVIPLMYLQDAENYVITASNYGKDDYPSWFVNLQANPEATIQVNDTRKDVIARQASPEEKDILWAQLVEQAPFFEGYRKKTRRDIPMVLLQPKSNP